ncbi:hypothetical protein BH11BAC3_BH11BAC3_31670 [soil metagenome]
MNLHISFIVPCFNCVDTIDESVMSIINGNIEQGDEIILVDDASTDDTLIKLKQYQTNYPFVKVVTHNINKGTAAAARNTGIDQSNNGLIFCLDSDNILHPHSVAKLKNFLLTNDLDVAAFGAIEYFSDNAMTVKDTWNLYEKLDLISALNNPMKTPCGSGNFLYAKSIWKKVGRYNESVGGAFDSELFGLKLLAEGAKFWTLPGQAYLHRNGYESTFIKEYNKRNPSLLFLSALVEYLHLLNDEDVEYIFGKGRTNWMDNIEQRPLRKKIDQKKSLIKRIGHKLRRSLKN